MNDFMRPSMSVLQPNNCYSKKERIFNIQPSFNNAAHVINFHHKLDLLRDDDQ